LIKSIFVQLLLQLQAHPDPEINQVVDRLLRRFQTGDLAKNAKFNPSPLVNNHHEPACPEPSRRVEPHHTLLLRRC
jgi:hypothetical protein